MKRYWVASWLIGVTLLSGSVMAEVREYELKDHPILTFEDTVASYEIKLKGVKCTQYSFSDQKQVTVSYIVKLNKPLSSTSCNIYISLLDNAGFEITSKKISSVIGDYIGNLKGNFVVNADEYQKISGSELFLKVVN